MMYVQTDGGRVEAGIKDTADCAVRAYALFKGVPYADAWKKFNKLGRKTGKGTPVPIIEKAMGAPDLSWKDRKRYTLNELLSMHPTGRVYAIKRAHAFCIIDGVLHDTWKVGLKSRVYQYWVDEQPVDMPVQTKAPLKEQAWGIWAEYNRVLTQAELISLMAEKLKITKANARYYVTRVFVN
jgi:hypothetical protein